MKAIYTVFVIALILQSACNSNVELQENSSISSNSKSSVEKAEIEAQKLLESGVTFHFTVNADGVTNDGGIYTGHGYASSDGIPISTSVGFYNLEKNAQKAFEESLKDSETLFKREQILDNKEIVIGERVIGISKSVRFSGKKITFFVGNKKDNSCKFYYSPSLSYLLAFEKWRD